MELNDNTEKLVATSLNAAQELVQIYNASSSMSFAAIQTRVRRIAGDLIRATEEDLTK